MSQEHAGDSPEAALLKDEGNAKFKVGEYRAAVEAYTRSLELDSSQHLCYSNRSAAYLKLGASAEEALRDAERCVELAPQWPKGYSRLAAALQELRRWDDAAAACQTGLAASPDDALKKMLAEVQSRRFQDRLQGTWHGTVSETLGGYEQEMEFFDGESVRVEVLGRSIVGKYWVDASIEPHHLNIQVPMQDVPMGMPPPPPVPYIAKLDSVGLHICCPFMRMERPTEFEGPGLCLMVKGPLAKDDPSAVSSLTREEQLLQCARDLTGALPTHRLEEVSQYDSEDATRDKLMAQVKFESSMYAVQRRFGEEVLKEVLGATKGDVPPPLADTPELRELQEKLRLCGILDDEEPPRRPAPPPVPAAPAAAAPAPAPQPSQAAQPAPPAPPAPVQRPAQTPRAPLQAPSGTSALLVTVALAAGAAVCFVLWRRR